MEPPAFASERFDMRPWTVDDLDAWHAILGDPQIVPRGEALGTTLRSREFLETVVGESAADGPDLGWFAVVERSSGEVVGNVMVRKPRVATDGVELGWHVRRDRWGEGIATEVARAAAAYADRVGGSPRLVALILPENRASQRIARKLGMLREGPVAYAGQLHQLYAVSPPPPVLRRGLTRVREALHQPSVRRGGSGP
jgi:RimJ/RimL family protein N-acetyltransferase